jgi:hypothetical protein
LGKSLSTNLINSLLLDSVNIYRREQGSPPVQRWTDMPQSVNLGDERISIEPTPLPDVDDFTNSSAETYAEAKSFKVGDYVSWQASGGTARGRITKKITNGSVPDIDAKVTGTPEDPAYQIRIYREGQATDILVGHKGGTLQKTQAPKESNSMYYLEEEDLAELDDVQRYADDVDEVYKKYKSTVNMSASELRRWADNPCSSKASLGRGPIKRNLELLETEKANWTAEHVTWANRTISFVSRMKGMEQGSPVSEGCPSKRDISLKNWAYNPSKSTSTSDDVHASDDYEEYCDSNDGTMATSSKWTPNINLSDVIKAFQQQASAQKLSDDASPIPNYRPGPACATCAASMWNIEYQAAICQLYNVPIFSSYICDKYVAFQVPTRGDSYASQDSKEALSEVTTIEEAPVKGEQTQPQAPENYSTVEPSDKQLYARIAALVKAKKNMTDQDKAAYTVLAYKKEYKRKYGDKPPFTGQPTMQESTKYANYKKKKMMANTSLPYKNKNKGFGTPSTTV